MAVNINCLISPLNNFERAKKNIENLFGDLQICTKDLYFLLKDIKKNCPDLTVGNELKSIKDSKSKVGRICQVLTRYKMKVVFFGSVSNGKSTVINALLGEKILPSNIGQTTNCFIEVERSPSGEKYLVIEGSNENQDIESVTHLAHALNNEKILSEKDLVHLYWPKDKCSLLRHDVALVDSPGINITTDLDGCIYTHCIDSDVFVWVANAESTLKTDEKKFFHQISKKLSKPNIFVLLNRWDASADEPECLDKVREQHMVRATDFLVKELKVCTPEEAVSRIFFISAKEVLQFRINERNGQALNNRAFAEGFTARYSEFVEFEHRFEDCISKSAIKTKFSNHSQQGKLMIEEMLKIMETIYIRVNEQKHLKMLQKIKSLETLNLTEQKLEFITNLMQMKIHQIIDFLNNRVSKALNEEIQISVLVDEFNLPFDPDALDLNAYIKELDSHVKSGVCRNLRAGLISELNMNIDQCKTEIIDKMSTLLPEDEHNIDVINHFIDFFELTYRSNFDKLRVNEDFHEKLEFKFSWSLSKLLIRVANWSYQLFSQTEIASKKAVYGSLAMFVVLVGFMLKTFGSNFLVANGAIYGSLYLYERLSWKIKDKEREFKRQYVYYATENNRLAVDLTSSSYSQHVQIELSSIFARFRQLVDKFATDLNDEIKILDQELKMLTGKTKIAEIIRNKADLLKVELKQFDDTFLCVEN